MRIQLALTLLFTALLAACANAPVTPPSQGHLNRDAIRSPHAGTIPQPVQQAAAPPKPRIAPKLETYSVVVNNVPVHDLLFALARDAKLNVDIHPGIKGEVTLNAIDQTLPQLLARLSKQVDMRYELDGPNLIVMPDTPYLHTYRVDYVNMSRDTSGIVTVSTQIGSPGIVGTPGAGSSATAQNQASTSSATKIENIAKNRFWETLIQNIKDILRETDKILPAAEENNTTATNAQATFREAAAVIANPETGIVSIRATARQHVKIQEFLDQVLASARRQVLIEATIAEVQLSDNYQQGIDWSNLRNDKLGFRFIQQAAGTLASPGAWLLELGYNNKGGASGRDFSSTVKLLETFGNVKVLSSPKVSVLNNQTAVLKVVDNRVYFTIESNTNQNQTQTIQTFTTTVHSVPVGFVMNVTPQIGQNDNVLLNIRPSLSRIIGVATDPNPSLKAQNISNEIPIIRSRELESMLRVESGNIAVMGGLMEDILDNTDNAVPGLHKLPLIGNLFSNRNDTRTKTELVIFLRPTVIHDASLDGDYQSFSHQLPTNDFFSNNPGPEQKILNIGGNPQ